MELFLVEFDNGMDWDDRSTHVVGVYSSQERAQAVADQLDKVEEDDDSCGGCVITVITLDEKIK